MQRPQKFLADEMLAKLVRFMRICGIRVRYVKDIKDDAILRLAKKNGYALLTCDEELARRCKKRGIPSLYLPEQSVIRQLALVVSSFRLPLPPFASATLCPSCGGKLKRTPKSELAGKVYPRVLSRRRLFWKCASCAHIYWSGTHYARLKKAYGKVKRLSSKISPQ